ncbi:MAG: hypothetical protein IMZ58_07560 [Thermoplasmata archaeon]|nr:hypothetical protein [Thermoplasmata archaeon]
MTEKRLTISDMYSLDWKMILSNAIHSRETSWGGVNTALVEYRNASDTLAGAVIDEMKKKGFLEEK